MTFGGKKKLSGRADAGMHLEGARWSLLADWLTVGFRSEWAKKVDWKQGGTAARPAGKPPKAPITALEAYVQYLRSQALKSVRSHAPDQEEQHSSVAILKVNLCARHHLDCP